MVMLSRNISIDWSKVNLSEVFTSDFAEVENWTDEERCDTCHFVENKVTSICACLKFRKCDHCHKLVAHDCK